MPTFFASLASEPSDTVLQPPPATGMPRSPLNAHAHTLIHSYADTSYLDVPYKPLTASAVHDQRLPLPEASNRLPPISTQPCQPLLHPLYSTASMRATRQKSLNVSLDRRAVQYSNPPKPFRAVYEATATIRMRDVPLAFSLRLIRCANNAKLSTWYPCRRADHRVRENTPQRKRRARAF